MTKKAIPSIHIPIQGPNGSIAFVWYLFFQWISDNIENIDLSDYFTKEEINALLSDKANIADLAPVAFSGDYDDLIDKPTIPAAQVNSDWNATSGVAEILNKPTIPTVNDATITITQGGVTKGSFTTNQSGDATIALDMGSSYHPDLFDWKWADHQVNDVQWLRADTFSWQAGSVYEAAFNELFNDIYQHTTWYAENTALVRTYTPKPAVGDTVYYDPYPATEAGTITAYDALNNTITVSNGYTYTYNSNVYVSPTTETVAGITVTYYLGTSGRKIVPTAYMSAVESVYAATGVAWYYIIDVPDKKFKLPRTKFGVTGLRDTVGKYVAPGLPNITGTFMPHNDSKFCALNSGSIATGMFSTEDYGTTGGNMQNTSGDYAQWILTADASRSSAIYGNSTTVQPPATQMYLYFYVGEFTQTALENTAGLNAELFNDKVDVGHEVIAFQAPTSGNNYTWYRKYADGWVEQGQKFITLQNGISNLYTLPIPMADTNYFVTVSCTQINSSGVFGASSTIGGAAGTTTQVRLGQSNEAGVSMDISWEVKGMAQE